MRLIKATFLLIIFVVTFAVCHTAQGRLTISILGGSGGGGGWGEDLASTATECGSPPCCFSHNSASGYHCDKGFDDITTADKTKEHRLNADNDSYVGYDFGSGDKKTIEKIRIYTRVKDGRSEHRTPITFEIRASNTAAPTSRAEAEANGDLLASETDYYWGDSNCGTPGGGDEDEFVDHFDWVEYEFENSTAYQYYWIWWSDKCDDFGDSNEYINAEYEMYEWN